MGRLVCDGLQWQATQRAHRLARSHRHEHTAAAAADLPGAREWHLPTRSGLLGLQAHSHEAKGPRTVGNYMCVLSVLCCIIIPILYGYYVSVLTVCPCTVSLYKLPMLAILNWRAPVLCMAGTSMCSHTLDDRIRPRSRPNSSPEHP